MTRKDYVLIAGAIADRMRDADHTQTLTIDAVASRIADALQRDNPRFDRGRFMAACWCEGE